MGKYISKIGCLAGAVLLLPAAASWGVTVNGLVNSPRVFNDIPTSTLVMTNSNTNPGTALIHDAYGAATTGANRHDIDLSTNNGASAAQFSIGNGYTFSTTFILSDGANAPRKEAGIRINSPTQGDALFIVNSDAGEIVAFGAGAPFHLFGNNAGGNGYVPGTPITLTETYTPAVGAPSLANPGSVTYSVVYPTRGINASFTDTWSNLEGGPQGYVMAVYGQGGPAAGGADFMDLNVTNISASVVPEPASLAALGMGGLVLLGRRRQRTA